MKKGYYFVAKYVKNGITRICTGNFEITVRDVTISNGAGFAVIYTGNIMTMPGLPKVPAAEKINIDENGKISGLF